MVQIPITTFSELRNRAVDACAHEWIFSLDSDERCTPAVRDEILALLAEGPKSDAYYIPRRNYFMGRWIKGSGWYPNFRQPQFFRKGTMRYTRIMHEGVEMQSGQAIGKLENAIVQYPFHNFEEVLAKANRYSTFGARKLAHKRVSSGRRLGTQRGLSSNTIFSSSVSATAGRVLSLRLGISRVLSTATPSATKK